MDNKRMIDSEDEPTLSILPVAGGQLPEGARSQLLELQLKMATSSINHEYARIEFDEVSDRERRDELLEYMGECRQQYFDARSSLSAYDPFELVNFEADLMRQKQMMLGGAVA